ncbi:predicted protein [Nematostella vectensis]|uniref:Proteasome subunit beta n=1 Tax=Nematostella vectensis TaxID=45351 RepID=A7S7D6_NEMVE|nr:predicted protein [Nematostella vectensis]|eukprot:XP_001632470.1 predicted protein [Nematostella vectensis]
MAAYHSCSLSNFDGPLWSNGPSPGGFYHFPGGQSHSHVEPVKRTMYPTTTGTSVLGIKFNGGVLMAADTLGSYGSLARYRNISRLMRVNENTIIGAAGDYADFQYIKSVLEQKVIDDACLADGHGYTPKSIFSWLTRTMYYRRTKFDPLWNQIIVGGIEKGESFLGFVDKIGIAYEAPTLASGFGAYLAQPLLRDAYEKNPNMSEEEARKLLVECLKVLFYRDGRSLNRFEIAVITKDGTKVEEAQSADTNWSIAPMVKGYE